MYVLRRFAAGERRDLGTCALVIFLVSLGLAVPCLVVLAWSALGIYKTLRYGYRDFKFYSRLFGNFNDALQDTFSTMEERSRNLTSIGLEMRENVEDIRDALDELRHHPFLQAAQFFARFRT